jgi:alanyl-tRNA synthetase
VTFEEASSVEGLRKASGRAGTLRIVSIANLDRSACGGTHVRTTGEIGVILLRSTEKIRGNVRLEFVCGARAVRRARADFSALETAARSFSASLDEVPPLISVQAEKLKAADKLRRKLESELGDLRGKMLYANTEANAQGLKVHLRTLGQGPLPDDVRAEANSFIGAGRAVFVGVSEQPPAVMIASSADSGIHAGNVVKQLFAEFGGKGGGSAQMAQGSFLADPKTVTQWLTALLTRV